MTNAREILLNLIGKETVSPAAKRAGDALDDLGDDAEGAARKTKKLDNEIEDLNRSLAGLAAAYAAAGTAEERADIGKSIRKNQSQLRQILNVKKLMGDAGGDGATAFSLSFTQRVGPLLARAPISGPIAGAIAAGAPFIASAIGGAVTLGLASGAVAGGVALAVRDPKVKAAGEDLGADLNSALTRASRAFVPETLRSIDTVRSRIRGIEGELAQVFGSSANYLRPLTSGALGFVEKLLPGLRAAVQNAQPLIALAEEHLPKLGQAAGEAFEILSRESGNARITLDATLTTVEALTTHTASLLAILSSDVAQGVMDPLGLQQIIAGTDGSVTGLRRIPPALSEVSSQMATAADVSKSFRQALDDLTGVTLNVEQAELRWQEAIDSVKASIDEHGRSLNKSTEDGRANRGTLVALAEAGRRRADTIYQQTAATQSAEAAEKAAQSAYAQSRNALVASAQQFTRSKAAAERYVTEVLGIPPARTTKVTADTAAATRNVRTLKDLIAAIQSKRVVITTVNNIRTVRSEGRNTPIGDLGGRAAGGPVRKNQAYVVGEKRAEVFVPSVDGTIIPSIERFDRMTGRAGVVGGGRGGDVFVLQNYGVIGSRMELDNWLTRSLDDLKRRGRL